MKAIILGSSRGVRRLDSSKSYPTALIEDRQGRRVLDWMLSSLSKVGIEDVYFVGGYHIEKVVLEYPGLQFHYDPQWQRGEELTALARVADKLSDKCLILRSDIAFRSGVIEELMHTEAPVAVAETYCPPELCGEAEPTASGIFALDEVGCKAIRGAVNSYSVGDGTPNLSDLVAELKLPCTRIEAGPDLVRIDSPQALSHFIFGTKAKTLDRLRPLLEKATILDQVTFTVAEWRTDSQKVITHVLKAFGGNQIVVRSSALSEDTMAASQAGYYHSELNVTPNEKSVRQAVNLVIDSFAKGDETSDEDEVLVQPHLDDVKLSGVAFTRDPDTGAPYLLVNYDLSNCTDSVTSGQGRKLHTAVIDRSVSKASLENIRPELLNLRDVATEICELTGLDSLDLEFAFDSQNNCYIFQVRPLIRKRTWQTSDEDLVEELDSLTGFVSALDRPRPNLPGAGTVLANMSDWNPAEIVGVRPRPLAWSLYRHIITDRVWGHARTASGYKDTFPEPLIVSLAGHPYVDTRTSFSSFLPADLCPKLGEKVVDYCVARLRDNPEYHDKIEFEVALTCKDLDFSTKRARLMENGFSTAEIDEYDSALTRLTDNVVRGKRASIDEQLALVAELAPRREMVMAGLEDTLFSTARIMDTLLDDCRRLGTLPFSILARYAFIATSFLRSMVARDVFTKEQVEKLYRCLPSVASAISSHVRQLASDEIGMDEFLDLYGHLRPGTYEITSPSYAEAPEFYFNGHHAPASHDKDAPPNDYPQLLFASKKTEITALLEEAGFTCSVEELQHFITRAIPERENAKFEFTKNLSQTITLAARFGEFLDLSRDEISFLPIDALLEAGVNSPPPTFQRNLKRRIGRNTKRHQLNTAVKLPHILLDASSVRGFEYADCLPNYITSGQVTAPVTSPDDPNGIEKLPGTIALIESADPGFDWIFSRNIAGLVTMYGGAASHMAIRAAELGLPAAIGCGERLFNTIQGAQMVELDCATQRIQVVR